MLKKYFVLMASLFALSFLLVEMANPKLTDTSRNDLIRGVETKSDIQIGQMHVVKVDPGESGTLTLDIKYSSWQNGVILVSPAEYLLSHGCFEIVSMEVSEVEILTNKKLCRERALDLSPYLKEGMNRLTFKLKPLRPKVTEIVFSVTPRLFGSHILSTLGCLGLFVVTAIGLFIFAQYIGLGRPEAVLLIASLAYYSLWLHFYPNLAYTADVDGHLKYASYMTQHWTSPYEYRWHEHFQPPLYYFIAGQICNLFGDWSAVAPVLALRIFALSLYMIFNLFGVLALHAYFENKNLSYYSGACLLLFWPGSITLASNITNDLPLYAVAGAVFYCLVRWMKEQNLSFLRIAVALLGLMFAFKTNAVVMAGILSVCLLVEGLNGHFNWRYIFERRSLRVVALLLLGLAFNLGKVFYLKLFVGANVTSTFLFGEARKDVYPVQYFFQFDVTRFITEPFWHHLKPEPAFLNYFLKTALYSQWVGKEDFSLPLFVPGIVSSLLVILILILSVGTSLCLLRSSTHRKELVLPLVGISISLAAVAVFTVIERYQYCQHFRYVLPMLVAVGILYVQITESFRTTRNARPLYWFAVSVGVLLPLAGVTFHIGKFLMLDRSSVWLI